MIPLRDDNPTRRFPVVTVLLIALNIGVYFLLQPRVEAGLFDPTEAVDEGEVLEFNLRYAAIPCEVVEGRPLTREEVVSTFARGDVTACQTDTTAPPLFRGKQVWLAVLYSMFLHGGLLHLGGNMLFLWVFGNNIEDHLGRVRYVVFYLASGVAATVAHIAIQPDSTVPLVGASGAIAGVMGAYLVWFPRAPILTLLVFVVIFFRELPARWVLGVWFVLQFFVSPNEGVAWMAHVGGFVFGAAVALLVRVSRGARHALWRAGYADQTPPWPQRGRW